MESVHSIQENELKKYNFLSYYPLIYKKVSNYESLNFEFENKKIEKIFYSLFGVKDLKKANDRIYYAIKEIFLKEVKSNDLLPLTVTDQSEKIYRNLKVFEKFSDFSKLFFAYDFVTKKFLETRIRHLQKNLETVEEKKDLKKSVDGILFNHDGWWNNYYGPLIDNRAKEVLLKALKNKNILNEYKNNNYGAYTRFFLTLGYRLFEAGEIKKARKIVKKAAKTNRSGYTKNYLKNSLPFRIKSPLRYFIAKVCSYNSFIRYQTNCYMFLYRSATKKSERDRYLKKTLKINNQEKILYRTIFKVLIERNIVSRLNTSVRPQHHFKIIEALVDKIIFHPKERKQTIIEIKYHILEAMRTITEDYYDQLNINLNYFILTELFFVIFYYLEKIEEINIQEY